MRVAPNAAWTMPSCVPSGRGRDVERGYHGGHRPPPITTGPSGPHRAAVSKNMDRREVK